MNDLRFLLSLALCLVLSGRTYGANDDVRKAWLAEYSDLSTQLENRPDAAIRKKLKQETFHPAALILDTDKTPSGIVLRRTRVLLNDLGDNVAFQKELDALNTRSKGLAADAPGQQELFLNACDLRRRIAFSNPLLDFEKIVFLTHHRAGYQHMVDQYYGFRAKPGGSVWVLDDPFGENPTARDLMAGALAKSGRFKGKQLENGSFISLDLNFAGKEIVFAWTEAVVPVKPMARTPHKDLWNKHSTYHIFKMNTDGTELTQLTDGKWNDFDPCFLPDGNIAFISGRRGGFLRCGVRPDPVYTLHGMNADGSDIRRLSHHETHEWQPSVDHNGMIVYTRWDYVDRDPDIAHHLWLTYPDGRDPRALHGNYPIKREFRPWIELSLRAIPGSDNYIGLASSHHGQSYGSLIMIDLSIPDDRAMSQVKRITPDIFLPEAETSPGVSRDGRIVRGAEQVGSPWPLSEKYTLCVYDPDNKNYGIYLLDCFGNRELIHRDPNVACLDPFPLKSRQLPPALPNKTRPDGTGKGEVAIMNVYESELPWPDETTIDALRIIQLFPKTTPAQHEPSIGYGEQSLGRGVLGTVPVEKDGSAYFQAPSDVPIYFQALDKKGRAVQSMRSATYLHEGERLSCIGCHESKSRSPASAHTETPLAFKRSPSTINKDAEGSYPLTFPGLVQDVLDRNCTDCHEEEESAPSLKGDQFGKHGWSVAYQNLTPFAWTRYGGNQTGLKMNKTSYSIPGQVGARASKLLPLLENGHYEVKLSEEDMHRITLWLDASSLFYGVYHDIEKQARGEKIMPILQ